ncbi:hypothetical protein B0H14DRAFT_3738528 [Mycena olivaceomarginata]|nr:hypothetical protein B0H14DRAFT_3738528 [Mycena olivaceomarginata]
MSLKLDLRLNTEHEANMRRTKAIATGPIILHSSRSTTPPQTPALLAPRVVVRVVHCIVQHEQALRLGIAPLRAYTPTLCLALCAPLVAHQTRHASRSRTYVPAAATASTLVLYCHSCADADAVVEPLPHGEAAFLPSALHVHIISPVCHGYITAPRVFASSARAPPVSNPLRRRMHLFERAAGPGREGEGDNAQSPPTSFDEEAGSRAETAAHHEGDGQQEEEDKGENEEDYHDTPAPHPWYKPSVPVLLALVPPIGNWLTGGDPIKDLLLLLLLVFYLHQIVRSPGPSTTPPVPAARLAPRDASPTPIPALRVRRPCPVSLRNLELGPPSSASSRPSLFSTALFGLATALHPLRELVSRTSTLHSQVHAHLAQLAALRVQVARLELVDALAPLEKGCKAGGAACRPAARGAQGARGRVPVPFSGRNIPTRRCSPLVSSWFGGSPAQPALSPHTTYVPPPLSPTNGTGSGAGKRRALDSILEEEGGDVPLHVLPHPRHTHPAYTPAHADVDASAGGTLVPLLRAWLTACVALAVYPLYAVLKPVGCVVGVGVGLGL